MKKIYLSFFTIALAFTASAQLTLTKAFNEPVSGNVHTKKGYDSTTVLPKNTGANQVWNFSSIVSNTVTEVSTFTTPASTPSVSLFTGATLAEGDGTGAFNYWKSTASNYELLGMADAAGNYITYTNSAIAATWPISFGYTNLDTYGGSAMLSTFSGPATGTIYTTASGTGTLILPGSLTFTNVLQVGIYNNLTMQLASTYTINIASFEQQYYHSTQKFSLFSLQYERQTITTILGPTVTTSYSLKANNAIVLGINEATFDKAFVVYPNPANGMFHVMFSNEKSENISLEIVNNVGQNVRTIDLGNANDIDTPINVSDLSSGVYFVKTSIGNKSVIKKLIIQ